ncbi:hypothetical protein LINPERPRIM_LOCUS11215, partial [Linum perenne]
SMESHSSGVESASRASVRGKTDPAWEHVNEKMDGKVKVFTCLCCGKEFRGGGITRMKKHLAGVRGDIARCLKVPSDVREDMLKALSEFEHNKRELTAQKRTFSEMEGTPSWRGSTEQSTETINISAPGDSTLPEPIPPPNSTPSHPFTQRTLQSAFAGKDASLKADRAIARWFYEQCFQLSAIDSPVFPSVVEAIIRAGPGYKGPSYYALRTTLLQDIKQECRLVVENLRNHWKEVGCTIMADGWTDKRHRSFINFLVYCPMGTCFVKSGDSSGTVKTADNLFKMFASVIEWVGPEHVVHVVTDNASNYVKAGKKITQHYKNIYWNPCVAHTMNLIMKDICALPHVSTLAKKASKVTIFVYNHGPILHWLQQRSTWREIVRPGATRFATTFLSLSSIVDRQSDLQALMVDEFWKESPHSKTEIGKAVMSIVLDLQFWEDCKFMVKLTTPIVRLLRIVDSDTKPALGYVHDCFVLLIQILSQHWDMEYYNKKKDTYDPVDYASIGAASEWIVEGDGASPPPDLDIDSFEQDLAGEEGEPYVDVDFGLGLGGVSHEDTSTFGLP